jgi:hypothetical protein
MILIGENLNIMSRMLGQAMRERNATAIAQMAIAEAEAGMI